MTARPPIRPEAETASQTAPQTAPDAAPAPGRRAFLRTAALAALALPAVPLAAPRAAWAGLPIDPARTALPAIPVSIRRIGRNFLVNGWVLTRADLDALGIQPV
jgi:hypothetical protein